MMSLLIEMNPPGRPKRSKPTERANLKLDSDIRQILRELALKDRRNESAEVEYLVVQAKAIDILINENDIVQQAKNLIDQKVSELLLGLD